jgi:hypothetical protein
MTFTVTLSGPSTGNVTVDFATADGTAVASSSDYAPSQGTLTFVPGVTMQMLTVVHNGDRFDEDDETFLVNLSNPTGATIADGQGIGTILDDDEPGSTEDTLTAANAYTDSQVAAEAAARAAADTTLQGNILAEAAARQQGDTDTLTAAKAYTDSQVAAEAVARAQGDSNTLAAANAHTDSQVAAEAAARAQGDNNTLAAANAHTDSQVAAEAAARAQGDSNTLAAANAHTDSQVAAEAAARAAADTALQGSLLAEAAARQQGDTNTLTAAGTYTDSQVAAEAAARAQGDSNTLAAANAYTGSQVAAEVAARAAADATLQGSILAEAAARQQGDADTLAAANAYTDSQIVDPDTLPRLSINDTSVTEGDTGTVNLTFTVTLSEPSLASVAVDFLTTDNTADAGVDYGAVSGRLTFAPGETVKTVTVPVWGDRVREPDETFFVILVNPTNAVVSDAQGTGTILNDDGVPPR